MRHSKRKTKITTTVLALALLVGWSASVIDHLKS